SNGKTVNIKWLIDTTSESIIVKGSQPDDILGIRQALIESFENDTGHSVDTRSLLKQKEIANEILIKSHIPIVTYILMMLNLVFLIIMYTDFGSSIIEKMWLDKNLVSKGEYYRLFTYMFTHGGIEHFVCNTFTLFIIGTRLEKYSGSIKFLVLYILSGIGAGLVSFLVAPYGVAVGASGAIFGIIGGLIYMIKKIKKNIGGFDYSVAVLYAIIGIFSGFFMTNIDNFAHIGGLIFGLILAVILRLEK
ncbi:MAG: rhomboid family intramembrane serine protease, partial [Lachnospirales bacterium]